MQLGSNVFLGHGGASTEYLKLGVWLTDLGLEWDVFDRRPTVDISTKERLQEMLDNARIAFLLMTPEDEDARGTMNARANVIHEVGLFRSRVAWAGIRLLSCWKQGARNSQTSKGLVRSATPEAISRPPSMRFGRSYSARGCCSDCGRDVARAPRVAGRRCFDIRRRDYLAAADKPHHSRAQRGAQAASTGLRHE